MNGYTKAEAVAVALCNKVRKQNQASVSTPDRMQCWHCQRQSGVDTNRMYMAGKPGYLGCDLMNRLQARTERAHSA